MKQTSLRKLIIDLADGENDGIISKRSAPVGNRIERIENGNTSLLRYLQHSRTNE